MRLQFLFALTLVAGAAEVPPFAGAGRRAEAVDPSGYAAVRYVSEQTGADENDGSRTRPWRSVALALSKARGRTAIFVAEGRYGGATVAMKSGVDLFGGFDRANWTRDVSRHPSILDGEGL